MREIVIKIAISHGPNYHHKSWCLLYKNIVSLIARVLNNCHIPCINAYNHHSEVVFVSRHFVLFWSPPVIQLHALSTTNGVVVRRQNKRMFNAIRFLSNTAWFTVMSSRPTRISK